MFKVPACYRHKDIVSEIEGWIGCGYKSYTELDAIDQESLSNLCINALGDDATNCIARVDNLDEVLKHLQLFIETNDREHAVELAQTLRLGVTNYFSYYMDQLFAELRGEQADDVEEEITRNKRQIVFQDNGEARYV